MLLLLLEARTPAKDIEAARKLRKVIWPLKNHTVAQTQIYLLLLGGRVCLKLVHDQTHDKYLVHAWPFFIIKEDDNHDRYSLIILLC